jgi:hypothetical protein
MKQFAVLVLVVSLFSGCVTEKKCRERFPIASTTLIKDTLIVTSSRSFDTLIQDVGKDTVFIRDLKTRIETKLVRVNDSIFVSTKCPSDTVRVEKVIQTIVNETKKETNWLPVVIAIVATTIVFFVFTIFMKLK